jgi:DNA polymerase (family 10)
MALRGEVHFPLREECVPVHNAEVAEVFARIADLLEIRRENPFRVRAYRQAALTVGGLSRSVADMAARGEELSDLPGIGKDLEGKIREMVETGGLTLLRELERELPPELPRLMKVAGLGPRRVRLLYEALGVESLDGLEKAAREGRIHGLKGFGEKTEMRILEEVKGVKSAGERVSIAAADEVARHLMAYLGKVKGVKKVAAAGSYRRRKETVRDLDVLVTAAKGSRVMERFSEYEDVKRVLSKGGTRSTVLLRSGFQVDVRVVPDESYGAALCYFTGSKAHNIAVRKLGVKRNLKINEYGVFRGRRRIAGRTEEEVYRQVGLPYIEPELRENMGEIEAARERKLPRLVDLKDIRGDLHAHTKLTDGRMGLEEMAEGARERGYEYLAITEHSKRVTVARGIDAKKLALHIKAIERLNARLRGMSLLKGIEVDILEDGSLDLPDGILKELDLVVAAVHYKFNLPRERQTERIVRAMDNPLVTVLAHPTGRLIGERPPYEVDMERLMLAASKRGCHMELNAYPDRLDLTDTHARMAKEMGVMVAVSTDAHSVTDLDHMRFGVGQARRGWLEPGDVINTRGLGELKKLLKRA